VHSSQGISTLENAAPPYALPYMHVQVRAYVRTAAHFWSGGVWNDSMRLLTSR
jgi:hypothetical protein